MFQHGFKKIISTMDEQIGVFSAVLLIFAFFLHIDFFALGVYKFVFQEG